MTIPDPGVVYCLRSGHRYDLLLLKVRENFIIIIIIISCRQHRHTWPSLTTSPLSFIPSGRSSGLHPVSSHSCCMYVRAGRPAFSRPYSPLVTEANVPITIGIIVTLMFHSFFSSLARSFFSLSFSFTLWSAGTAKSTIFHVLFFVDYYKVWSSDRD